MNIVRASLAAVLIAALTACGVVGGTTKTGDDSANPVGITRLAPEDRVPGPEIAGADLEGQPVSTAQWHGQVAVINVWGSWCPPCRAETPVLNRLANELEGDVPFLGVAVRESATTSLAFARKQDVPYPSISDSSGSLLARFAEPLPAAAVPTTYVLDRQGRVAVRVLDRVTYPTLKGLIEDVSAEAAP
ncbi:MULTISPECIES: TlpA disulfide reductase family protein [unclassified Aeromicrobium]|jgi:thiol-disulfide isomerase/thioredoxin|uniref:TlpA family protein disulfide reductase n=1 Tax=unclassified Aeromicrobium TaxID=2633570 RepID=UPI0028898055|nr:MULTISPECIES: TlpA disulfide reductase family protein [unclassified Aeromicrobium]